MWTINCPYFGTNIAGGDKSKLLKCGQTYPLGRKQAKIVINEPWISRAQGSFTVGAYTEGDVYNMEKIPTLEYGGGKLFWILRGGETITVQAGGRHALEHGDQLVVSSKGSEKPITPFLVNIVCQVDDIQVISAKDCAEMGIKVAMEYHPSITHHITDQVTGEPNQLPVLLRGGSIVTKEWAQELVHRLHLPANLLDSDKASLEDDCLQPPAMDHLPTFSPNLKRPFKQNALWYPNQDRVGMFQGRHFLLLVEGAMIANAWRDVILAGEGTYETFNIHKGVSKWAHQLTLSRGKAAEDGMTLVLIANEETLDAAVGENWKDFIRETERIGLRFLPYDRVTEAVLMANKELLKSEFDPGKSTSQLLTQIPGSLQDEASSLEPTQTVLRRRRAPSTTPAVESVQSISEIPASQEEEIPNRSQLLRRRFREPSVDPVLDPSRPVDRTLLRRRKPTQTSQVSQNSRDESVLDKHRRLFEETDPERQLGSRRQAQGTSTQGGTLMDMVEEADRQRLEALEKVTSTSRKRKAQEIVEDDPEDELENGAEASKPPKTSSRSRSTAPPTKKRTLQRSAPANPDVVAEAEEPPPTQPTGEPKFPKKAPKATQRSTRLDKDESFLVALASMKKGKRKEEQTDRDFNSLKISKPVVKNDDAEIGMLAWELLPKDMNIRGNFMVCVENVDVREGTHYRKRKDGNPEWVGRPDFKKFRKKVPKNRTAIVELVANLSLDGVDDEVVEAEPDQDFDMPHAESKGKGRARLTRTQVIAAMSENEESQEVEGFSGRTAAPTRSGRTKMQQKPPLFLPDSDEEVKRAVSVEQSDQEEAPPAKGRGKAATGTKRKAVVLAASSSDDEAYDKRRKKRR